jgi:tetratricopeptide (TPR) repeat protein
LDREGIPVSEQGYIAPIREAVEQASMSGQLVIPGGERLIGTVPDAYRSGYVRINDSLGTALAYFAGEFRDDESSRAVMYWLLGGYIATGQINTARDLASKALETYPDDIDIMNFDAIVSYLEGDTASSERMFRRILDRAPVNPYANLNLAVLLSERGHEDAALELLETVLREHGDTPFASRARRIAVEIRESGLSD